MKEISPRLQVAIEAIDAMVRASLGGNRAEIIDAVSYRDVVLKALTKEERFELYSAIIDAVNWRELSEVLKGVKA